MKNNILYVYADKDECADPTLNDCDLLAKCKNHLFGYTCECNEGYTAKGRACEGNTKLT